MKIYTFRKILRNLSCALFLLFLVDAQAQFNHAYHHHNDVGTALTSQNGNYFGITRSEIYSWRANGDLRFSKSLYIWGEPYAEDVVATGDGGLIIAGGAPKCDVGLNQKVLIKMDTSGTELFKTHFTGGQLYHGIRVLESSDGHFYVSEGNFIGKFTAGGVQQAFVHPQIQSVSAGLAMPNNQLLYSAMYQNNSALITISDDGTLLQSGPAPLANKIGRTSAGSLILFGKDGSIHKYSKGFSPAGSYTYSNTLVHGTLHNDTIYAMAAGHSYLVLDTALNLLHHVPQALSPYFAGPIVINGSEAMFMTVVPGFDSRSFHFGVTAFPKNSTWKYTTNAGITQLTDLGSYLTITSKTNFKDVNAILKYQLIVKNYGTDTIHDFVISEALSSAAANWCQFPYFTQRVEMLLPPGDSAPVQVDEHEVYWLAKKDQLPDDSVQFHDMRIYLTVPNNKMNGNTSEYVYKWSPTFAVPTDIEEITNASDLKIFPNPSKGLFTLESTGQILDLSITDMFGRVFPIDAERVAEGRIDLREFPSGVYFIRMSTGKGIAVRKVLITQYGN